MVYQENRLRSSAASEVNPEFKADLNTAHLISRTEEIALATQIRAGLAAMRAIKRHNGHFWRDGQLEMLQQRLAAAENAREKFARANLRLVISVVSRIQFQGVELNDLIQEGNVGLVKAINKFDPQRGTRFSTYAVWWIRHEVQQAIAKDRPIKSGIRTWENNIRPLWSMHRRLTQELNRSPTPQELAIALNWDVKKVRHHLVASRFPISLNSPRTASQSDGNELGDGLSDSTSPDPIREMEAVSLREELQDAFEQIDPRSAQVVKLRHGLFDGVEYSFGQIGRKMKFSREYARKLYLEGRAALEAVAKRMQLRDFLIE